MKELLKTRRITLAIVAFIGVLIIGFATLQDPVYSYKTEAGAFAEELFSIYQVTPDEAMEWMYDSSMAVFIDVRGKYEYEKGHIENAINIPVPDLLDPDNKELYEKWKADSITVVLYGKDELQANGPWMLMYQLGYTNMRALMGGYGYIDRMYLDALEEGEVYTLEDPAYDYAGIIEGVKKEKEAQKEQKSAPQKEAPKKKPVVVKKKEKKAAEGGC
jgi:rhodanese-related sulfurtransferase